MRISPEDNVTLSNQALDFILACPDGELHQLRVKVLAQRFGVSRVHLSRCFSRDTGVTLRKYLHRERMERARDLLRRKPDLTISQVSRQVGIDDTRYFRRLFNKYYGISPQRVRPVQESES